MTQPDIYLLGRGKSEELRLKRQIADLAPLSDAQLVEVGIKAGERVIDLGCGPGGVLHLLSKKGRSEQVRPWPRRCSSHFVELARHFAADLGLTQVEVPGRRRLRHRLAARAVVRPGALHAAWCSLTCRNPSGSCARWCRSFGPEDGWRASKRTWRQWCLIRLLPPSIFWLRRAYNENARSQGIDLFIRPTHAIACSGRRVLSISR